MRQKKTNGGMRTLTLALLTALSTIAVTAVPSALALPAERHYEMVSPVFKGGYAAPSIQGVAVDGEGVAFYSPGSFAGAPSGFNVDLNYLARRGVSGWLTTPVMAPATLIVEFQKGDMTPSLNLVFEMGHPGPNSYNPNAEEQDLLTHSTGVADTSAGWELGGVLVGPLKNDQFRPAYRSASLDLCHVLLSPGENEALLPEAGTSEQLYEFNRGCNGEAKALSLVGLDNKGKLINPNCHTAIGDEQYSPQGTGKSAFNAVSADGGEVFFTPCITTTGPLYGPELPHQVFVRLAASRTLEVSRPLEAGKPFGGCVGEDAGKTAGEVPCEGAAVRAVSDFAGASEDGSKVYFTTSAPLTGEDKDTGSDLYLAGIGCPSGKCGAAERQVTSLRQVSHDPVPGQAAEVQGVVRVAPDGSRVYFVAQGDLLTVAQQQALEGEGRPVPQLGAENLYVYDSNTATAAFIGDLCSGSSMSGAVEDIHCPSATGVDAKLWNHDDGRAQTAGADGRFLVFTTFAQLSGSDRNVAQDVYRYDSQTALLTRVSGGEDGFDDNGNRTVLDKEGNALGASIAPGHYGGKLNEQHEMDNRAVSDDGSRVVFTSAEPLSPKASNGLENVYEWHQGPGEGAVSLISTGSATDPVKNVVISASGRDIFFVTSQGLVPQDTDGAEDVYDARLGEGFPEAPALPQPCSGDACQGPLTNPAPLLVPGSVSQAPGENLPPPVVSSSIRPKSTSAKCRKGYARKKGRCVKRRAKKARHSNHGGSK